MYRGKVVVVVDVSGERSRVNLHSLSFERVPTRLLRSTRLVFKNKSDVFPSPLFIALLGRDIVCTRTW